MRRYMFLVTFMVPEDAVVEFSENDIRHAITQTWSRSNPDVQALRYNGEVMP